MEGYNSSFSTENIKSKLFEYFYSRYEGTYRSQIEAINHLDLVGNDGIKFIDAFCKKMSDIYHGETFSSPEKTKEDTEYSAIAIRCGIVMMTNKSYDDILNYFELPKTLNNINQKQWNMLWYFFMKSEQDFIKDYSDNPAFEESIKICFMYAKRIVDYISDQIGIIWAPNLCEIDKAFPPRSSQTTKSK